MARDPELDDAVVEYLASTGEAVAGTRDVTDLLLDESARGPGEKSRTVAEAKPARDISRTPTLETALQALRALPDKTMGFISKPLAYGRPFRYLGKRDHTNLIRLIKGGHVRVYEVSRRPPPGSGAHLDSPYGDRYYVLHVIT